MNCAWTLITRKAAVRMAGFLVILFGLAGCSEEGTKTSAGREPACASGEVKSPTGECACPAATLPLAAGGCQPAGLPLDMPCPPGEMLLPSGSCEPAGVPPEACGEGFEPDGKRGCNAIQPEEDCPEGLMAIPGETKCREVAPCGSGTWGDIPVEADTVFVDSSYSGGGSNGTKEKPWTKIQAGINAAEQGVIVAVAAGSYEESIKLDSKPVRLWGRCPSMVEVAGVDGKSSAILILRSNAAELRNLAVRGPGFGLWALGSMDVIADRVWVHHTGSPGVRTDNSYGPASITVSSSLVEAIAGVSVISSGASLTLSQSVVRDTVYAATIAGVAAEERGGERGRMTIFGSVISRTHWAGVGMLNAIVQIESTLIRDTRPLSNGTNGQGVYAYLNAKGDASSDLTIRASIIEGAHTAGILAFGPGLTIESTVIRKTLVDESGHYGRGIILQDHEKYGRGRMTVRDSLVEDNYDVGIGIYSSDALIEGTIVRDTKANMNSAIGNGVSIEHSDTTAGERSTATIRSSVIQRSVGAGILVDGSSALIERSIIADTKSHQENHTGIGVAIQRVLGASEPATAIVRSCLIERSVQAGVTVVDSDATIETSHVRDVQPDVESAYGDGIMLSSLVNPTTAHIYGTRVESTARAGIASFGGHVVLDKDAVSCTAIDIDGETSNGTDFIFDDRGGTACGCPAAEGPCLVLSSGLQPPPIDDL